MVILHVRMCFLDSGFTELCYFVGFEHFIARIAGVVMGLCEMGLVCGVAVGEHGWVFRSV